MKKVRNSNLELLRIISIIIIIAHHYAFYGFAMTDLVGSFNQYIVGILSLGGKLGVVFFILISGYFMVNSQITIKKLLKIIIEVWIYSVVIGLICIFVLKTPETVTFKSILKMILPISYRQYWFVSAYVMLMIISPLLNILIKTMSQELYKKVLVVAIIMWSLMPSFLATNLEVSELGWFVVLYFIAGYIRCYLQEKDNAKKHMLIGIIAWILLIASNSILIALSDITGKIVFLNQSRHFAIINSPLVLIIGVELLIGFSRMKPFANRFVNTVASTTLGIYLIHENQFFRQFLWKEILNSPEYIESNFLVLHAIISITLVFVVGVLIDLIRQATIARLVTRILDAVENKFYCPIKNVVITVIEKVKKCVDRYYG